MNLVVQELTCGYQGSFVLQHLSFKVSLGETIALLGPNGSGKSTLIKTLGGQLAPLSGSVEFDGRSIKQMRETELAKVVATVPQEEIPIFSFSVREIVMMGRLAHSSGFFDTAEDVRVVQQALETADCEAFSDRPITELSGGERQRTLIARSLAQETPYLLLDEPTSHLDPLHQMEIAMLTRRLADQGKAIIAAVHDLNLAFDFADRCLLLAKGKLIADGPTLSTLKEEALEETYGISFERLSSADGRVFVRAKAPWSHLE